MSKKANTSKKSKKSKPEQMKLKHTGRIDAIPELEDQAIAYAEARDAWQEQHEEMMAEQAKLTDLLKKHGKTEYLYEGADGRQRRAFIPDPEEPAAKVQLVKPKKTKEASE